MPHAVLLEVDFAIGGFFSEFWTRSDPGNCVCYRSDVGKNEIFNYSPAERDGDIEHPAGLLAARYVAEAVWLDIPLCCIFYTVIIIAAVML